MNQEQTADYAACRSETRSMKRRQNRTRRQLIFSIVLILVLCLALSATAIALSVATIRVDQNAVVTGRVAINLNNGKPVLNGDEMEFEPGAAITRTFFLQNNSSWSVYYKLYLDDIVGDLSRVLEITISDGDKILYQGMAVTLEKGDTGAADDVLEVNEIRTLTLTVQIPEEAENEYQDKDMYFNLCAEAVQTKNNPSRLFD